MVDLRPTLLELTVADTPEGWVGAGFEVEGAVCRLGAVAVRLRGSEAGRGLTAWTLSGISSSDLDGISTRLSSESPPAGPVRHPNGAVSIDHVVAASPDLDRTVAALEAAGLPLRRIREGRTPRGAERQAFFRLGEPLLEVIEEPSPSPGARREGPARLWGIALLVDDLDLTVRRLGDGLGPPRDAVQPGRRIAPLRRSAGLGVPLAFITPRPGAGAGAE